MIRVSPPTDELATLLEASCLGEIQPEQARRLQELVCGDAECRIHYVLFMHMHAMVERREGQAGKNTAQLLEVRCGGVTDAIATSPFLLFSPINNAVHGMSGLLSSGWPVAYLLATAILGIALLIGSVVPVSQPVQVARQSVPLPSPLAPLPSMVGRITGMVDCKWEQSSEIPSSKSQDPRPKTPVSLGDKVALASGLMEITYDTGATVILQGPVMYEVESKAGGYLSIGKLTARLDKRSEISASQDPRPKSQDPSPHPLFSVRTPTAVLTDLGTEFGVEVGPQGQTTSHVFRGSVKLQVVSVDGKAETVAQVLHENQSACVQDGGDRRITLLRTSARLGGFVRQLPKQTFRTLDLVDVVAGGDGFSGKRGRGIDPTTGRPTDAMPTVPPVGDYKYHRVEGLPFVDGVFIADGSRGPVQVSSTGVTFDGFLETCNRGSGLIFGGGRVIYLNEPPQPTDLNGVDYASPGHGLIFVHANNAITFDLAAIRRANRECKLLRFRAVAGNTEGLPANSGSHYLADLWVLVDGQSRFQRRQINRSHGAFAIAVPLHNRDRFLTLAATDGGDGHWHDSIIFGDPQIELLLVGAQHGSNTQQPK